MIKNSRPIIDFDHHGSAYVSHWEKLAEDIHRLTAPLAWSPHYGGFWVLASWEKAKAVAEDWETFTSDNDRGQRHVARAGEIRAGCCPTPGPARRLTVGKAS
jgi:hypothetical protein